MPQSTSSGRVCCPREMMTSHVGCNPTMSMLSNCDNGMPRPTLSDYVFIPMVMMACHARHILTLCAAQGRCLHATLAIVRSCIMTKSHDVMQRSMSYDHVRYQRARFHAMPDVVRPCLLPKCEDGMKHPTSSDHVSF